MNTSPAACVACASTDIVPCERHEKYELYQCSACDLQFWWPFQNPGNTYYQENESEGYIRRNTNPLVVPLFVAQRRFLRKKPKLGTTMLDLGMGTGRFLAEAKKRGYVVTGSDFDVDAVSTARSFFGLSDVHQLTLEESLEKFQGRTFDFITMFDVIEHLDSFDTIQKFAQLLSPNGKFVISTPWRGHSPLFGAGDYPPLHLTRWSNTSMRNLLEQRGFSVVSVKHIPVNFRRFMMKFNGWTAGGLSFDLTKKLSTQEKVTTSAAPAPTVRRGTPTRRQRILSALSIAKLYGLFFVPACVVYAYLWITGGRHATHIYIVAERA